MCILLCFLEFSKVVGLGYKYGYVDTVFILVLFDIYDIYVYQSVQLLSRIQLFVTP